MTKISSSTTFFPLHQKIRYWPLDIGKGWMLKSDLLNISAKVAKIFSKKILCATISRLFASIPL
jgi:hypothetical protein